MKNQGTLPISKRLVAAFAVTVVIAFWLGYAIKSPSPPKEQLAEAVPVAETVWYCSMHPQIRQNKPGKCPICHMDLIPYKGDAATGERVLEVTPAARALMNVTTSPVERKYVQADVRMVGKVAYNETRLAYITAWVPGRIDRMYVDYTGVTVNKGDHMVDLYSPELLTAQEEVRRAAAAQKQIAATAPESLRRTAATTLDAVREKLRRWGLTDEQIKAAESADHTSDHVTVFAPTGGTVIKRDGQEGMYVDTGTQIYTIADLGVVWVMLEAYESDLPWIHFGQTAEFTTESYPGEIFEGKIAFIDPVLNDRTRTVAVRVNVPNPNGRLKPGMFVRGVVKANVATGGRVMDPGLAGKWISPMHPEIVKDGPGACDICGMPLVPAEELGYVTPDADDDAAPLVIPATAPLITGKRAVVYVDVSTPETSAFEGRMITLGPRAGDYYLVEAGLEEGELVVTQGNFRIDSALQIAAKLSMMSADSTVESTHTFEAPEAFRAQLGALYESYLTLQTALTDDSTEHAKSAATATATALGEMDMTLLTGDAHNAWMLLVSPMQKGLSAIVDAADIDAMRVAFEPVAMHLQESIATFGIVSDKPVFVAHCPMAFGDRGADWLQASEVIANPYYGHAMLKCGEITGELSAEGHRHE